MRQYVPIQIVALHVAAVDRQDHASHELCLLGHQKRYSAPEIVRLSPTPHRRAPESGGRFALVLDQGPGEIGVDPAGRDGVDANPVLRPGGRETLGELHHAALRGRVAGAPAEPKKDSIEAVLTMAPRACANLG